MKKALLVFILIFLIGAGGAFFVYRDKLQFFEHTPPTATILNAPKAIGVNPLTLHIQVSDEGAGLDEVIVRSKNQELLKKSYPERGTRADTIDFLIDPKILDGKDGSFELTVKAFDKSFFSNGSEIPFTFLVDVLKPKVEAVSVQHNGTVGGALLTFYRILSNDAVESGVKVGENSYQGYQAKLLDPAFSSEENLYFSLFPISTTFNTEKDRIMIYAIDGAGNVGISPFYQKIKPKGFSEDEMRMPHDFFVAKINEILPQYLLREKLSPLSKDASDMSDDELASNFRKVNEDYRQLLNNDLLALSRKSISERLWNGAFDRPLPAKPTASFAEKRKYIVGTTSAGGSTHMGIDLAQSANSEVRASGRGKVVFADDLGIYGNAVVMDHGFGLISIYGHLSSIAVNIGDLVEQGGKLGRTGSTGLAGGDHLHFELRLQGVPVSPFEWLDPLWIKSHFDGQIQFVKTQVSAMNPTQSETTKQ